MSALPACPCMCEHGHAGVGGRQRKGVSDPLELTGVIYKQLWSATKSWDLNLGPLEEEPSIFLPPLSFFVCSISV